MSSTRTIVGSSGWVLAVVLAAPPAQSQDTRACITSHARMQELLKTSRALAAREAATACAAAPCPAEIRAECSAFQRKLDPQIPSLVVVVSGAGEGRSGFIEVDGEIAQSRLEGGAIRVDPGKHRVRVELDDGRSAETEVTVELGQKRTVALSVPPAEGQPMAAGATPDTPADASASPSIPTMAWIAGGIGIAGVLVGSYFGLRAISLKNEADDHCPTDGRCFERGIELRDDANDAATISTVAFAVGIAGLGTAAALVILAPVPSGEGAQIAIIGSF